MTKLYLYENWNSIFIDTQTWIVVYLNWRPSHGKVWLVIISYHIISYRIVSYHIISYHIISYHIISYHIISYHIISYHIASHSITSHHITSYIISYHIRSDHIRSYVMWCHVTSRQIISYHIISYIISYHIIFSQLSIIQYVGLCVFSLPISLVMIELIYIHFVLLSSSNPHSLNYYPLSRVRSWNNGVRCMSFYILISCHVMSYHIISYRITSYHFTSHHITSYIIYHIMSYHIISYHKPHQKIKLDDEITSLWKMEFNC